MAFDLGLEGCEGLDLQNEIKELQTGNSLRKGMKKGMLELSIINLFGVQTMWKGKLEL